MMTPEQKTKWKALREGNNEIARILIRLNEIAVGLDEGQMQFYLHGLGNMQAKVDMEIEAVAHEERWRK